MDIGENIRLYRKKNGLTQTELGEEIGVTGATITRYEKGIIANIPQDKIEKLAEVLRITPSELIGWSNTYPTNENVRKLVDSYISKFISGLKAICENLSLSDVRLTDEFFLDKANKISATISDEILNDFYNDLLSKTIKNMEMSNTISLNNIRKEIYIINVSYEVKNLIEQIFYNFSHDIYKYVNNNDNNTDSKWIVNLDFLNRKDSHSIIDTIESTEAIYDISDALSKYITEELFNDVFIEIVNKFIKQLNMQGKEMTLEYIKYLLSNSSYKEGE